MRMRGDEGLASVVGAVIVLAILGTALLYVNAFHVPRQGAALEVVAADAAAGALRDLAVRLGADTAPVIAHEVPLRAPSGSPPLLSGVVLAPVRAGGAVAFDPDGSTVSLSVVTEAPPGGVPQGDPVREAAPGDRMRVHLVGNVTAGAPLGVIEIRTGGAYGAPAVARLEGGAVLGLGGSSSLLRASPALVVEAGGSATAPTSLLRWSLPLFAGAPASFSGADDARITLTPGPPARQGGGAVHEATIRIETSSLAAWRAAVEDAVGPFGTVEAVPSGAPDHGAIVARVLPPAGAPSGIARVEIDVLLARYVVRIAGS